MCPRVTVVVVCYNQARFVPECLESVRRQTRPAHRVLITDDLSTDSSRVWSVCPKRAASVTRPSRWVQSGGWLDR